MANEKSIITLIAKSFSFPNSFLLGIWSQYSQIYPSEYTNTLFNTLDQFKLDQAGFLCYQKKFNQFVFEVEEKVLDIGIHFPFVEVRIVISCIFLAFFILGLGSGVSFIVFILEHVISKYFV